jgi:hypothetical protein
VDPDVLRAGLEVQQARHGGDGRRGRQQAGDERLPPEDRDGDPGDGDVETGAGQALGGGDGGVRLGQVGVTPALAPEGEQGQRLSADGLGREVPVTEAAPTARGAEELDAAARVDEEADGGVHRRRAVVAERRDDPDALIPRAQDEVLRDGERRRRLRRPRDAQRRPRQEALDHALQVNEVEELDVTRDGEHRRAAVGRRAVEEDLVGVRGERLRDVQEEAALAHDVFTCGTVGAVGAADRRVDDVAAPGARAHEASRALDHEADALVLQHPVAGASLRGGARRQVTGAGRHPHRRTTRRGVTGAGRQVGAQVHLDALARRAGRGRVGARRVRVACVGRLDGTAVGRGGDGAIGCGGRRSVDGRAGVEVRVGPARGVRPVDAVDTGAEAQGEHGCEERGRVAVRVHGLPGGR